jgi:hypothetical protein
MRSAPYDLSISAARASAPFASPLQRLDEPGARQIRRAIATVIGVCGVPGLRGSNWRERSPAWPEYGRRWRRRCNWPPCTAPPG